MRCCTFMPLSSRPAWTGRPVAGCGRGACRYAPGDVRARRLPVAPSGARHAQERAVAVRDALLPHRWPRWRLTLITWTRHCWSWR